MAIDRQESPYRRGKRYDQLPIPMVTEHCIPVDAGAVQLVVESRKLTNEIIESTYQGGPLGHGGDGTGVRPSWAIRPNPEPDRGRRLRRCVSGSMSRNNGCRGTRS